MEENNSIISWSSSTESRDHIYVEATIKINSTVDELWSVFESKSYLELIHPFCHKHEHPLELSKGNKELVVYMNNNTVEREIIEVIEKEALHFEVTESSNRAKSIVYWKISRDIKTLLTIRIETKAFHKVPRVYWQAIKKHKVLKAYKEYLGPLLLKTKAYIESPKKR